jgi:hypothetical protein
MIFGRYLSPFPGNASGLARRKFTDKMFFMINPLKPSNTRRLGQANSVAASRINRPIGRLRGQDFSASLKSIRVKRALVRVGNVSKV